MAHTISYFVCLSPFVLDASEVVSLSTELCPTTDWPLGLIQRLTHSVLIVAVNDAIEHIMSLKFVFISLMFNDIINVYIGFMNARSKSLTALSACSFPIIRSCSCAQLDQVSQSKNWPFCLCMGGRTVTLCLRTLARL